jgi:hypothetical protein
MGRMNPLLTLVACPSCSCHARPTEIACPHCGAPLRRADGTLPRTAGAMLLGLVVAAAPALAGCPGSVETGESGASVSASSSGGTTTTTTTTTTTHCTPITAAYGLPPTCVPTSSSSSGAGGAGGAGGHGGGH